MDDDARRELMAQALLQHMREKAKQARQNLPFGIVLFGLGVAILLAAFLSDALPIFALGLGFILIPSGIAAMMKSVATIAAAKRVEREHELPSARVVE